MAGEGREGKGRGGGRKNAHTMTFRHASIMTVRSAVFLSMSTVISGSTLFYRY